MAETKKKRLTTAELTEQLANALDRIHQLEQANSELAERLDRQSALIHNRMAVLEEGQGEMVSANLDALRILWLCCGRQNLEKQRARLVILGNTLKEYVPDFDEATA